MVVKRQLCVFFFIPTNKDEEKEKGEERERKKNRKDNKEETEKINSEFHRIT